MGRQRRLGWLPVALRGLERKLGADREGRTLWVWVVPFTTVVVTFLVLAFIGAQGKVDLALTIPMALTLSLFLGSLSAFYLTAASSDERDIDDDGPDDRHPPLEDKPPGPPPGAVGDRSVVPAAPVAPPQRTEEPVAAPSRR
jgi:hypothetical protein